MEDWSKIYLNDLQNGEVGTIAVEASPEFLDLQEEELKFKDTVYINGVAYLAGDSLILRFRVRTRAYPTCRICNNPTQMTVVVPEAYHVEKCENIDGGEVGVFDIKELVREAVLLEIPIFAECDDGKCPERENIATYLKEGNGVQRPFADLKL